MNGPDLDKGPSDLSLDQIFQVNGLVNLPWKFQISGIFRAQSGFHFSQFDARIETPTEMAISTASILQPEGMRLELHLT